jgi:exosortase/archaeosortase family protein
LPIALFSILWLDLIRLLSGNWEAREQYAYGWFVPFFALGLLIRRWLDRPSPLRIGRGEGQGEVSQSPSAFRFLLSAFCFLLCLSLLPLRVIFEINTDWPLIAWTYTLLVVALTLYAFHLAGPPSSPREMSEYAISPGPSSVLRPLSSEASAKEDPPSPREMSGPAISPGSAFSLQPFFSPWLRHFAFPVAFILVALVWPYRIEKGLTQNLMQAAASLTVEIIGWFGVPAFQRGNLIEISTGVLGVDEACSGIRSFQSTLMAALFLGELYRLRVWARTGLVFGGLLLAFAFNVVRTLILTWQANKEGLSAIDKWHDPAGFTITIACFFVLWGIAVLVKRKAESRERPSEVTERLHGPGKAEIKTEVISQKSVLQPLSSEASAKGDPPSPREMSGSPISPGPVRWRRYAAAVGLWSLLCILATEAWYRSHANPNAGVFHWTAVLPESNPTYQKIELPPRTLKLLSYDEGASGKWIEEGVEWSAHFFRWKPRSVQSVITSRVHRPEVCLPASGLQQIGDSELVTVDVGEFSLPFRKYTFQAEGRALHVFFCQWEDGAEQQSGMQASKQGDRLQSVLSGRRLVGQQTFELILTGFDSLEEAEQAVRQHLPRLVSVESSTSPSRPSVGAHR